MSKDSGPTLHVTDAGRDEIARPARGLSVGQRRLLQALIIHGSASQALAADVVLQRRPLQGDLDRLTGLGLIVAGGAASAAIAVETDTAEAPLELDQPRSPEWAGVGSVASVGPATRSGGEAAWTAASNPMRGRIAASVAAVIAIATLVIYMKGGSGADAKGDAAAPSPVAAAPATAAEVSPAIIAVPPVAAAKPVASARFDAAAAPPSSPRSEATAAPRKEPAEPTLTEKPAAVPPSPTRIEPSAPQVAMQVSPRIPPVLKPPPVATPPIAAAAEVNPAEAPRPPPTRKNAALEPGSRCSKLDYPPLALRAEQSGAVVLNFLVDVDGRVTDSKIDSSSGYRILDEAARNGLSRCKFVPATVGGRPELAWTRVEYVWRIEGN
jgi:protein TonB